MARGHALRHHSDRAADAADAAADPATNSQHTDSPSDQPNMLFGLKPVDTLPKRKRAPGLPKLPRVLSEAAEVYVGLGPNSKFSQAPVLPTSSRTGHLDPLSAFLRIPGDNRSKGLGLSEHVETYHRLGTPSDHGADDNGITMNWTPAVSRHHIRRTAQHLTWLNVVIPSLVSPLLEYMHGASVSRQERLCTCASRRWLNVVLAHWDVLSQTTLQICDCNPAATQLMQLGFFPCAPKRPSIAFSLPLLEFISIHSLNVAPNSSAWADTLQLFWQRRKYMPMTAESLRKRLGNAIHWYQVLINRKDAHVQARIEAAPRHRRQPAKRPAPSTAHEAGRDGKRRRVEREVLDDGLPNNGELYGGREGSEEARDTPEGPTRTAHERQHRAEDVVEDARRGSEDVRDTPKCPTRTAHERQHRVEDVVEDACRGSEDARATPKGPTRTAHERQHRVEDVVEDVRRGSEDVRDTPKGPTRTALERQAGVAEVADAPHNEHDSAHDDSKAPARERRVRFEEVVDGMKMGYDDEREAPELSTRTARARQGGVEDIMDVAREGLDDAREAPKRPTRTDRERRARVEDVSEDEKDGHDDRRQAPKPATRSATADRPLKEDLGEGAQNCHEQAGASSMLDAPSDLLRRRCPLCFGGPKPALKHTDAHALVCIDANFAQKRRKSAVLDPALEDIGGRFLDDGEVRAMEAEVEGRRKGGSSARSSRVADEVLDECEKSFIAAQEGITKASKNYYSDTGLMAILCRHDRVLWVVNMTSAGEKQFYALALLDRVMRDLPQDWRVGVLYDIACQLSRSIEKFGYLEQYASRLSFAVSVFHAYGHQWTCQLVYHPRKRSGFGLTDGEGCERFWSAIRRLIAVLRVCGFFRRLFILNRQFDFIDQEGLKKSGKWLARRWRDCMKRLHSAETTLKGVRCDEGTLEKEWKDQVRSQLVKPQRQSKSAGEKAVNDILLEMGRVAELAELVKRSEAKLRKTAHKMRPSDLQALTDSIDSGKREVKALRSRIKTAAGALGTESARQLQAMRGDDYVCARVNARALRANIREAVRAHKFERERLERAYRRQVMQHKDHAQTRDLVHRKQKTITSMVTRYNALVKKMEVLVKQGRVPTRRTRAPRRLDAKELFKLDVDDHIWQEDPGLGPQDEGNLPRWQVDNEVRIGIPAMLEARRCREELERLDAEARSLVHWWTEERRSLADVHLEGYYDDEVRARREAHDALGWMWTRDLASAGFSVSFEGSSNFTASLAIPPTSSSALEQRQLAPGGEGSDNDDDSAILSEEGEDEPVADHLDEVADAEADDDDQHSEGSDNDASESDTDPMNTCSTDEKVQDGGTHERDEGADPSRTHKHRGAASESTASNAAGHDQLHHTAKPRSVPKSQTHRAFSPSAIDVTSGSDGDGNLEGAGESGRCCGAYSCTGEEVLRFVRRTEWVSGDGIAVLAESFLHAVDRKRVGVVPSTVFRDLGEYWSASKAADIVTADKIKDTIARKLRIARMPRPSEATKWLIVVHIEVPKHWVLVEVRWRQKLVRFYDSYALKDGYANTVKENAFRFLKLCGDIFGEQYNRDDWTWVGEERPLRQTNGYDCGPFIVADVESLLGSDTPSTKSQSDMRAWRAHLGQRLRSLPRDTRDKASIRVATSLALSRGVEVFDVDADS